MILATVFTLHLRSIVAFARTMANIKANFAKLVLGLHSLDDVLLLLVRSIPELGTYRDFVGQTSGPILPLVGMGMKLANSTGLLGGCRRS